MSTRSVRSIPIRLLTGLLLLPLLSGKLVAAPSRSLARNFLGSAQVGAGGDDLGLGDEDLFGGNLGDLGDLGDDDLTGGGFGDIAGEISPGDSSLFRELSPGVPLEAAGKTATEPTGVLIGLRDLATRALAGAGVVKRAEHGVRAARRALEEVNAAQWPSVKLMAEGRNSNHRNRVGRILGTELAPQLQTPLSQMHNDDAFLSGFDVSAPLYRGGLWGARENVARQEETVARLRQLQAVEATLVQVVDLYLDVLMSEAAVSLDQEKEKQLALEQGEKVSRARDRFTQDQLALESELALARLRSQRARREGQRDLARARIKALVGAELEESFRLERSFDVLPSGSTQEDILSRARRGNLEIRVQMARAKSAREGVVEAASAAMPEVNLDYNYRYSSPTISDGVDSAYWNAALRLDVPLFDGGRNRARKQQARELERGAELLVQETVKRVEAETSAAFQREQRAKQALARSQDLVSLARRNARAVQDRVDGGTLSGSAAAGAQVALLQARLEAFRIQAEVIRSRCRIHALTGELLLDKF